MKRKAASLVCSMVLWWISSGLRGEEPATNARERRKTIVAAERERTGDVAGGNIFVVGWSARESYSHVTISEHLSNGGGPSPATVFLMRKIGPGTTEADEVARTNIDVPTGFSGFMTLFSDLSLGPGTYWLVLSRAESFANLGVAGMGATGDPLLLHMLEGVRYLGSWTPDYSPGNWPRPAYSPAAHFTQIGGKNCNSLDCLSGYGFIFHVTGEAPNKQLQN